MKRKLLSVLLTLCLAFSLLPTAALAEGEGTAVSTGESETPAGEYVAKVGEQGYATLAGAFDAAKESENDVTIVLQKSCEGKGLFLEAGSKNITIDLVLAAVLALFALLGARKGLIRSLMALVSVVVALIGATLLTAMFVEPVTDLVYPKVEERVLEQFERDIPSDALAAEDGDLSAGGLLPDELSDLLGEALDTLKRFGVSDDAIDGVTKSVTDSAVSAAERAAYLLVKTIVQAALFLAFFLALMLLLRLLTHGLDRLFSLPVLAQLNGLGGAALSLMEGALLIFLIVFLAPRLGVTWFADHAAGTHLLAWFLNNTPRSIIASLT